MPRPPRAKAAGDVNALLDQALAKVAGGVVTNVKEPKTGTALTLDKPGLQGGVRFALGDKGIAPAPTVSSSIPVMVVTTSYDSRGSETNTKAVTAAFSDVTSVFVPGIANVLLERGPCYLGVASAFLANPGPVDTACLTSPAVTTLT